MRTYDMVYIIRPSISEEEKKTLNEKLQAFITKNKGEVLLFDDQGVRHFPHQLQKETRGHYYNIQFAVNTTGIDQMKNYLGVTEQFFRYIIVRLESIEKVNSQVEKTEEKTEA